MNKIRVLFLTYMYPNAVDRNAGIFVHEQAKSLLKADCEVKIVCPMPYSPVILSLKSNWKYYTLIPKDDRIDDIPVHYPRYFRLPGKWFHGLSCYTMRWSITKSVHSIIKTYNPHVIHAHMATPVGYLGLMLSKRYGIPLVCTLHGSDINSYPDYGRVSRKMTEKTILGADQTISVSNALKSAVYTTVAIPRKEIQVVYNGCDSELFAKDEGKRHAMRAKMKISEKDKVIIFIGTISRSKGVFELIAAFLNLHQLHPDLHLVLVGPGPDFLNIKKIIETHKLNNRIHLIGNQPNDQIPDWLSAADIFALPSHNEGLPIVILEAMACGLPVIGTRVGGIPEEIENEKNGILIDKGDSAALSRAIQYLIYDKENAKKMGSIGREIVKEKFSWQQNVEKVVKIYKQLIDY